MAILNTSPHIYIYSDLFIKRSDDDVLQNQDPGTGFRVQLQHNSFILGPVSIGQSD